MAEKSNPKRRQARANRLVRAQRKRAKQAEASRAGAKRVGRVRVRSHNRKRIERPPIQLPSLSAITRQFARRIVNYRRALFMITAFSSLIVAAYYGVSWMLHSQRFTISEVHATPLKWMPQQSFDLRVGLEHESNMFRYDVAKAIERLEASPWVRHAKVRRQFPRGLSVELEENVPAAVALIDELYLVDLDGIPFKRTTAVEAGRLGAINKSLLVLTGISREDHKISPEDTQKRIARAIWVASQWNLGPRPRIVEVNCDSVRGLTLITEGGTPVIRLGDPNNISERLELFDRLWMELTFAEQERVQFIHLDQASDPSRVAIAFSKKRVEPWAD